MNLHSKRSGTLEPERLFFSSFYNFLLQNICSQYKINRNFEQEKETEYLKQNNTAL